MPRVKALLLGVEVRPAGRKSHCAHNRAHVILKGQARVVVKAPGIATPERGYCIACGELMIEKAELRLQELRDALAV